MKFFLSFACFSFFLGGFIILAENSWAISRSDFSPFIKDACYSSITYSLDDNFEEKSAEYEEMMNCSFRDAFKGILKRDLKTLKDSEITFSKKIEAPLREILEKQYPKTANCSKYKIPQISLRQKNAKGDPFLSFCKSSPENSLALQPYSACQVAEVLLLESCGYSHFMNQIAEDQKAFRQYKSQKKEILNLARDESSLRNIFKDKVLQLLGKNQKALFSLLSKYDKGLTASLTQVYGLAINLENHVILRKTAGKINACASKAPSKILNATR